MESEVDVAIVGMGPVGVSAANFLGHEGVSTVVFERDRAIYPRARAVTVNDWTLRAFQSVGLDELLKADMEETESLTWKTYGGKTVFRLCPASCGIGHPGSMSIFQPVMEQTLRDGLARYPSVDVHFGELVTALVQDEDGVTLTVRTLDGGTERTVRAKYVLACDGGSSRMRSQLGIELQGLTHEQKWIIIDAEMLRWWPDCKELIFWSDPKRPVVDIPLALGHHRWELPLREGETEADFDSEEKLWALLTPLGVKRENVRIKQHAFYVHHVRRAARWREGRVLLLGDAAHMMPPWAGQGMQSGIRDAHNVAWKLREVLSGRLGSDVLDTYEAERAPQVADVTEQSRKLGLLIAGQDPKFVFLRNNLGPLAMRIPALTRKLMPTIAPAVTTGWLAGKPGPKNALGRMIPQPSMSRANGRRLRLDDALGTAFAVLAHDADPRELLSAEETADWARLGARFIAVREARGAATDEGDLVDHTGTLTSWMRSLGTRVVAIRPDRFVAASNTSGMRSPTGAGLIERNVSQ